MQTQSEKQSYNWGHQLIVEEIQSQMSESNQRIKRKCQHLKESIEHFKTWRENHLPLKSELVGQPSQTINYRNLK